MKNLLLSIMALLCGMPLYAQYSLNQNKHWAFGEGAGIDFSSGAPLADTTSIGPYVYSNLEGCATVSDDAGNLLFYSTGNQVWDRTGALMPGSSSGTITPYNGSSSTQGALITPVIGSPGKYYVFLLEDIEDYDGGDEGACRLYYCVVDMSLHSGYGDIVPGSLQMLADSVTEKMIAVPGNDCNIWVVAHQRDTPIFKVYNVTAAGINPTPVLSTAGYLGGPGSHPYNIGVVKSTQDRHRLFAASGRSTLGAEGTQLGGEVYDFDPATGTVSNAITLDPTTDTYGGVFSPDGTKLYVFEYVFEMAEVVQYDVSLSTATAIIASATVVASSSVVYHYSDLQLGPDGKIYLPGFNGNVTLDCISNPNAAGTACNYIYDAVALAGTSKVGFGLPNEYVVPLISDTITEHSDTVACIPTGASLTLTAPSATSYHWYDGATTATHAVSATGNYWVSVVKDCSYIIDTFHVIAKSIPFSLGNDTTVCSDITLQVPFAGATATWQDGSTGLNYTVTRQGKYYVTVTDSGCTFSDTINVTYPVIAQSLHDTEVCNNTTIQLTADIPDGATALWSTGATTNNITVDAPGTYSVKITNGPCTGYDTATVSIGYCNCWVAMPSAFTPNHDSRNDIIYPLLEPSCPISGYKFSVYNRWGQEVFTTSTPGVGWDGTFNGLPADVGTYMYYVRFSGGIHKKETLRSGDITLVR